MPVVRCPLLSRSRGLPLVSAIVLGLILILPTACSDEQPTEPRPDRVTRANLNLSCAEPCFIDNFTDTGGTLLENHVPDGGTNSFAWAWTGGSSFEIRNNALTAVNLAFPESGAFGNYITDVVGDAVEIEVDVFAEVSFTQHDVAIDLRHQDGSGLNSYTIYWSIGGFGTDGRGSIVSIESPDEVLASVDYSDGPVPVGIHTMRAEVSEGGVINVYIDGVLAVTATDSSPLPPGRVGLSLGFTARPSSVRITSFAAGGRAQRVNVNCLPIRPTRGADVQCKTSLAIPEPYTVVRRTARGSAFTVEDFTTFTHQAGDTNVWQGPAVATTDVVVEVQLEGGGSLTNETPARFDVQARGWPVWKLTTLAAHIIAVVSPYMTEYPLPPPDTTSFGLFGVDFPDTDSPVAMPTTRPSSGPNRGLVYIRDPMQITDYRVYTHPALYPPNKTTPAESKLWYKDQNGRGSGTCIAPGDIARLASNVQRHEGVTKAQDSHFEVANDQFALLQPQMLVEALYSQKDDQTFRDEVFAKLDEFMSTGPYDAAQDKFDDEDTDRVYAIDCTLDYNPGDR